MLAARQAIVCSILLWYMDWWVWENAGVQNGHINYTSGARNYECRRRDCAVSRMHAIICEASCNNESEVGWRILEGGRQESGIRRTQIIWYIRYDQKRSKEEVFWELSEGCGRHRERSTITIAVESVQTEPCSEDWIRSICITVTRNNQPWNIKVCVVCVAVNNSRI